MVSRDIKVRMAEYTLRLGEVVREEFGQEMLEKLIRRAAKKSAEQKAEDLLQIPSYKRHGATADRLRRMLIAFNGKHVRVSDNGTTIKVENPECPCLPPFVEQAEQFGFEPEEVRKMACMLCMPCYSKGAQFAGVGFGGKLTDKGCWMSFTAKC